ncbi:hypothetical protein [Enterococcus rivorum]|uniref:hypothetical protein n=1 Tax=Enterococcus rivorum TaxID=762845 RepID=UPI001B80B688|nr:hypothetical protein [Enterococcus rivorum]
MVLSLSSLGVTASAEQKEKEASIIYYNAKEVTNADYILTIPSKLAFTQKNKRLDASVTMYDVNGDFYTGDKSVKVSVESKNNYNLRSTDDFMDIKYSMVKFNDAGVGTTISSGIGNEIGVFNKAKTRVRVDATLWQTAVAKDKIVEFEDTLTYTFTDK